MPDDAYDTVQKKVRAIFTELAGDRTRVLDAGTFPAGITSTITGALAGPDATDEQILHADQIAFHLTDWSADAAFIVALHLFPERFTPEEIEAAVGMFLAHVPRHVITAARLAGHSTEEYLRSPKFSDCFRCLADAGARCSEPGLLAVLLDDADPLRAELRKNPVFIHQQLNIRSAFTPLIGASLLHVAAEFGLLKAAPTLLEAGADVEAKAALDDYGLNGHTPILHTLYQRGNQGQPVLRLLLEHGARADIRLSGITWGKSFEWETTIFDATPLSYTQAGLLPQFGRDERDVYENIRLLANASGRVLPDELNVPNKYLQS